MSSDQADIINPMYVYLMAQNIGYSIPSNYCVKEEYKWNPIKIDFPPMAL